MSVGFSHACSVTCADVHAELRNAETTLSACLDRAYKAVDKTVALYRILHLKKKKKFFYKVVDKTACRSSQNRAYQYIFFIRL